VAIAIVALVISRGSLVFAGWSLWYAHRADGERARRASCGDRRSSCGARRSSRRSALRRRGQSSKRWSIHKRAPPSPTRAAPAASADRPRARRLYRVGG